MIRTLIIEDSQSSLELLTDLILKGFPELKILGTAMDLGSAKQLIHEKDPELVFLDVEIGDSTGFDLLNSLSKINFEVIFVTAFESYAFEAFKHQALHYIVKPVCKADLSEVMERAKTKMGKAKTDVDELKSMIEAIRGFNTKKIMVTCEHETRFIDVDDIICIKGDGSYSNILLKDNTNIMLSKLLKDIVTQLPEKSFYRISKSYIINLQHVAIIKHIDGGMVEMTNGDTISIPRRKRTEFTVKITEHLAD